MLLAQCAKSSRTCRTRPSFGSVAGVAIAFVLWAAASWRDKLLPRSLAIYGFACAVAVLTIVFAGLPLDAHHLGIVALLQAIFSVWAGVIMVRSPAPSPA
jgi:hypothetical protein